MRSFLFLTCIPLKANDVEPLCVGLAATYVLSGVKPLFVP